MSTRRTASSSSRSEGAPALHSIKEDSGSRRANDGLAGQQDVSKRRTSSLPISASVPVTCTGSPKLDDLDDPFDEDRTGKILSASLSASLPPLLPTPSIPAPKHTFSFSPRFMDIPASEPQGSSHSSSSFIAIPQVSPAAATTGLQSSPVFSMSPGRLKLTMPPKPKSGTTTAAATTTVAATTASSASRSSSVSSPYSPQPSPGTPVQGFRVAFLKPLESPSLTPAGLPPTTESGKLPGYLPSPPPIVSARPALHAIPSEEFLVPLPEGEPHRKVALSVISSSIADSKAVLEGTAQLARARTPSIAIDLTALGLDEAMPMNVSHECDACPHCNDVCDLALCPPCTRKRRAIKGAAKPEFTLCQVRRHTEPDDCWICTKDSVYDVTAFLHSQRHPGGQRSILRKAGQDCTQDFKFHSRDGQKVWAKCCVGKRVLCKTERKPRLFGFW
eukprot:m.181054 g.181054  ORF g.181054 m.181054 type:complete len:446 (+) comp53456_c0_seq1:70-1407(+)